MCDPDGLDADGMSIAPRPSPSCSSNVTLSPPTTYEESGQLRLPSLTAMFDDSPHRRSISLPDNLAVPYFQSQRQVTPPAYILPPPRRLLSPFDEARAMQTAVEGRAHRLPVPSSPYVHGGHQRGVSMTHLLDASTYRNTSSSYYSMPRQSSPMMSYQATTPGNRCSVNALLNHRGSFTI